MRRRRGQAIRPHSAAIEMVARVRRGDWTTAAPRAIMAAGELDACGEHEPLMTTTGDNHG